MYNAKRILSFCAKMRRYLHSDALKVASVERFSLTCGEAVTLRIEASSLGFSLAAVHDAIKQSGIHLHDVAVIYSSDGQCVWRVTFFMCKAGSASKLKSFFKL